MLLLKKCWPDNLWYLQPFHMVGLAIWNIYFIKETGEAMTFTDNPVEMFGADQSTMMFILHSFVFSYSYRYTVVVLFPLYFLINLATVFKIKHDTSIESSNK